MSLNEDANAIDASTVDARTIVELIRAQNRRDGMLLVEEADAIRLVATALRVAQDRGVIDGMGRMDAIAGKAFAAPPAPIVPLALSQTAP
jgi:hypothetical protein